MLGYFSEIEAVPVAITIFRSRMHLVNPVKPSAMSRIEFFSVTFSGELSRSTRAVSRGLIARNSVSSDNCKRCKSRHSTSGASSSLLGEYCTAQLVLVTRRHRTVSPT